MTPPAAVPTTAGVRQLDVLVVGSSNVCRSLAAERLVRARLGVGGGVAVTSAGTRTEPGDRVPELLSELLAGAGLDTDPHHARALTAEIIASADLVLTATRSERATVVRQVPAAVGRTFTLRELARVAGSLGPAALPEGDVAARLSALVRAAPARRGPTAPADPADDDLLDPAALGKGAYQRSFDQVRGAVDAIAWAVLSDPSQPVPAPPEPVVAPVRPSHRLRNTAIAILGSFLLLLLVATCGALLVAGVLDSRVDRFPDPFAGLTDRPAPFASGPGEAAPVTILVLGSTDDVRTEDTDDWAAAAAQTDVVMLAHVSADRSSAQVVAMPPDLWVEVPGTGPGTLRSAFAAGGPPGAVETVEHLTDVRLDHVALTDSETFARVTQELGGVDLDLTSDLVVNGRVAAAAGERRLTGAQALAWVRGTGDDDVARAERSAVWLQAILDRLGDSDVRGNPITWLRLLGVVSGSVAVDESFDRAEMVGLLTSIRALGPGEVEVVGAPTTVSAAGEQPVLVPDAVPFGSLMDALRTDTLDEHLDAGG
ncbi:LCP family protein [Cellulomonas sp.]|uniref:LCP family glycopolymer transferase n=1 Tax=Cellulomonas sp. TaxID=40001 RepID=UPI003BAA4110